MILQNLFQKMYDLLFELKKNLQKLLELSYEKRRAAHSNETDRLNEIVNQEMRYLSEMNSLEKKRQKLQESIAANINVPEKDITVSFLIEKTEGTMKERFVKIHREMNGLLKAQMEINAINNELLETQLEYTNTMLNVIIGTEDPLNSYYSQDGKASAKEVLKNSSIFDKQI